MNSLRKILQDEVQTPVPHLCARHVSTFKSYAAIVHVASIYYDEIIFQETLNVFTILIDSEEVDFLSEKGFADALLGFVGNISTTGR